MPIYWTAFDWGAYDSKTAHLSMTEDGAYRRLLSHYYRTCKPLVANVTRLLGVCRARTEEEIAAVTFVLSEFFELRDDGYHNKRADEELEKQSQLSEKRRHAGQKGGNNKAANYKQNSSNCHDFATASYEQLPPQLHTQIQLHNNNINTTAEVAEKPSKRRRTQKDIIAGFSEATKSVVNKAIEIWPTVRPGNNSPVKIDTAKLADRVDGLLKQPGIDADILLEAANMYLAEKKEFLHAPEYFFGPGKNAEDPPWRPYARMAYHNRNLSKAQVAQ